MKKIFLVTLDIPFPLSHGGALAQYFFLGQLTQQFDITMCTIVRNSADILKLSQLQGKFPLLKIIYHDEPYATESLNIKLKVLIMKVINLLTNVLKKKTIKKAIPPTLSLFENLSTDFLLFLNNHFSDNKYDIIQCEFFETLSLVKVLPQNSKKVFICHEIKFKALSLTEGLNNLINKQSIEIFKREEVSYLNRFDKIIVFNNEDCHLLAEEISPKKITVSPFSIPDNLIHTKKVSQTYTSFLFLGGESHYPNRDGLKWFLTKVLIPNYDNILWRINISGIWSKKFKDEFKKYDRINFIGFVEHIENYYVNSILIVPVFSGSGIRTKILQAFANKLPVISTYFGAEGLYQTHSTENTQHIILFENEEDFVSKFLEIQTDIKKVQELGQKGYEYYLDHFNTQKIVDQRMKVYEF